MADSKEQQSSTSRLSALHRLREGSRPARDLWPEIEKRISAGRSDAKVPAMGATGGRYRFPAWLGVAAAAALLLAVGVWIGHGERMQGVEPKETRNAASSPVLVSACVSDAQYQHERTALLSAPAETFSGLSPESRTRVLASLATVHDAVQDIETALARDSTNPLLQELLLTTCQDETRVLTEVQAAGSAARAGRGI